MKILVISLAGIGDTMFATPLIRELRANFPDARIDVLVKEAGSRDLLENNPRVNRVFYKDLLKCGRMEALRFLWPLRNERYELSINTHPQSRIHYRLVARLVGAKTRVSHEYECATRFDRWLVNRTLPQDYSLHAAENNLALLPLLGAKPKLAGHELEIFLTRDEQQWAEDFLLQNGLAGKEWLGVHVGSGSTKNLALRRWPVDHFIELSRRLQTWRSGFPMLFFGGPEEKDDHARIQRAVPAALFPPTKNLRQAAALLRWARAFLSVDTALMHIAAAMKVPAQIVIETPTWNKPIEPYGNPFTLVKNPAVAGRNLDLYLYDGQGIKATREALLACMASVTVDEVFATATKAL